jgi:hypothetical protein
MIGPSAEESNEEVVVSGGDGVDGGERDEKVAVWLFGAERKGPGAAAE